LFYFNNITKAQEVTAEDSDHESICVNTFMAGRHSPNCVPLTLDSRKKGNLFLWHDIKVYS